MHFLKKMMTAVIMLMAGLGGQGWYAAIAITYVDFPHDQANLALLTPGYRKIVTAKHDANPKKIVLCSFFRRIPLANDGDNFTWIQVPNANNANIYFPVDGRQPTTQEAAEWSCANINNSLTSPITEWYMRMFGWTDPTVRGQALLQMGFAPLDRNVRGAAPQTPTAIITLGNSVGRDLTIAVNERSYFPMTRSEMFWEIFRKIASNPVGRTLLYRLLIEIRRINLNGKHGILDIARGSGDVESSLVVGNGYNTMVTRNNWRSVTISYADSFAFAPTERSIKISETPCFPTVFSINQGGQLTTKSVGIPLDVALFHEMLHWFHRLRNPQRVVNEKRAQKNPSSQNNYIARVYLDDPIPLGINEWGNLNCEEIRTILGSPNVINIKDGQIQLPYRLGAVHNCPTSLQCYCNGDDLSENAYRASLRLFMRWGHVRASFIAPVPFPLVVLTPRYKLAHMIAKSCCNNIITVNGRFDNTVSDWEFRGNKAIYVE